MGKRMTLFLLVLAGVLLLAAPNVMAAGISLTSISPTSGAAGTSVECTIYGSFIRGADVKQPEFYLARGLTASVHGSTIAWDTLGGTWARVTFALPNDAELAPYDLHAMQYVGPPPLDTTYLADLPGAFTVLRGISLTSITPTSGPAGSSVACTIYGFFHIGPGANAPTFQLYNQPGGTLIAGSTTAVDTLAGKWAKATFVLPAGAVPGKYSLSAAQGGTIGGSLQSFEATLPDAFTVLSAAPFLSALNPSEVWAGYAKDDLVLSVEGGNFLPGAHVFLNDVERPDTSFVSATRLRVPLRTADLARPGRLLVTVKNPPLPPGTESTGVLQLLLVHESSAPVVTINGADSAWHNSPVPLTFSASDSQSGVQKLQYRSPEVHAWTDGSAYTVPLTSQGPILVSVRALDWCNGVGTAEATVNIDATPPTTAALNAVSVKQGKTATLRFRILEPIDLSPRAQVLLKVKRARGEATVKTVTVDDATTNATLSASFKVTFKKGAYRWYVYATDLAGNPQANVASQKFTVK